MMLNRIYLNNNEDTHYPLIYGDTGFPDDLISGLSIRSETPVYLYSVITTDDSVAVTLMSKRESTYIPTAYGSWDKHGHPITNLYSDVTGEVIGWISFGSGTDTTGSYTGMAEISHSCITSAWGGSQSTINGVHFDTPAVLKINTAGSLCYNDNGILSVSPDVDQSSFDGRDPYTYRCLRSVNNKVPNDNAVRIKLPEGSFTITSTVINSCIKNPYKDSSLHVLTITIHEIGDNSIYGCVEHDPIVDKFLPISSQGYNESPLDSYIIKYAINYASSRIHDTIVVTSGESTYTMVIPDTDAVGNSWYSVNDVNISDAITITGEDGESLVLLQTSANVWEDS